MSDVNIHVPMSGIIKGKPHADSATEKTGTEMQLSPNECSVAWESQNENDLGSFVQGGARGSCTVAESVIAVVESQGQQRGRELCAVKTCASEGVRA